MQFTNLLSLRDRSLRLQYNKNLHWYLTAEGINGCFFAGRSKSEIFEKAFDLARRAECNLDIYGIDGSWIDTKCFGVKSH